MGKGVTFVDWDSVGYTITTVKYNTGSTTRSVQGQDGLDGDVHRGCVEGFKHDLGHLFSVSLRNKTRMSQMLGKHIKLKRSVNI